MLHHYCKLFAIVLLLPFSLHSQNEVSYLEDTFRAMEASFGINISYNTELLKETRISKVALSGLSLEETFVKLLRNSPWEFEILSQKYVVIKEVSPSFYSSYDQYICGDIRDAASLMPLSFANVHLVRTTQGCSSDLSGNFQLNAPFVSNDSIEISYLGYKRTRVPVSYFRNKTNCPQMNLDVETNELKSIIVKEDKFEPVLFLSKKHTSEREFSLQKLDLLGGQVEKDVFQVLQLYPGVSTQEESASDINIRGGARGQNLVLYDGVTLYHFGHFFGKVSAVNPNFSDKVSLFTEGIDAKYGGRVAGVIDIRSIANIPPKADFNIGVNTLATDVSLHLPLFKNKGHLLAAYRKSYTDQFESGFFKKTFDQIFQNSSITEHRSFIQRDSLDPEDVSAIPITDFSDLNVKLAWTPNEKDQLSISFVDIRDGLLYTFTEYDDYQTTDSLNISNKGLSLSAQHHWNNEDFVSFDFAYSNLKSRYSYAENTLDTFIETRIGNSNKINDYAFKLSNYWNGNNQNLSTGLQYNIIDEAHRNYIIAPWQNPDTILSDTIIGHTFSTFLDYHYDVSAKAHFNFGLRASYYNLTNDFYLEPRFHANIELGRAWQFKISSGIYFQTINEIIELDDLNTNSSLWVLARESDADESDTFFSVVKNEQFSFGFEKDFPNWKLTIGAYQKSLSGITSRSLRLGEEFEFEKGNMFAQGLELSAQKQNDRLFSILSYTLGQAYYDFTYPDYTIDAAYDHRHNISWLQGFYLNKFTLSSTINWHTGGPYSSGPFRQNNAAEFPDDISYWIDFKRFHGLRLPNYFRWDMSLSWQFGKEKVNGKLKFAILNILNRENLLSRQYVLDYSSDDDIPPITEENKLGILFSPNLGLEVRF